MSLVFEGEGLIAFNIKPTVDIAIGQLQDIFECHEEVLLDSHLRSFTFEDNDAGNIVLAREYCRAGHELSLHHETMEDLMLNKCNNKNWGCQEREDIIERALEI